MAVKTVNGERRYGAWAGNPQGRAEDPTRCVEELHERGRGGQFYQCQRKRGFGPDGLYCKGHADKYIAEPITTYYRTTQHGWSIEPEPVYKETEKTIWIKQGRELSATNKRGYWNYWPSREAALEHLRNRINKMRSELAQAERQFQSVVDAKETN